MKQVIWNGNGGFSGVTAEDYNFTKGKAVEVPDDVAKRLLETGDAFREASSGEKLDKAVVENKLEKHILGENK